MGERGNGENLAINERGRRRVSAQNDTKLSERFLDHLSSKEPGLWLPEVKGEYSNEK
jgi:hypothetical protein